MPSVASEAEPHPPQPQQFFPDKPDATASSGSDDGREQHPEDNAGQAEADAQAADGGGLDDAAAATVAEGSEKEKEAAAAKVDGDESSG